MNPNKIGETVSHEGAPHITIRTVAFRPRWDFRYTHGAGTPVAWLRWKQPGAESSKYDYDRDVLLVTKLEGTAAEIAEFLAMNLDDLLHWADHAESALRQEHHLPERGETWDANAISDPAPLAVEIAEGLRICTA